MKIKKIVETKVFWGILALSLFARIYHLSHQSYWIDEMVSLYFTTTDSWIDIFRDNHPFLYHLILKIWIKVFGTTEFATRFLSVVLSVTTTFVIYLFGKKLFKNNHWAYFAAFLHAVSAFSIVYAQETRMYAILELAAAVNFYYFYLFIFEKHKPKNYLLSCLFLSLTHYAGAIILLLEGFYIFVIKKNKNLKYAALLAGIIAVGFVSYPFLFSWPHLEWQKLKYSNELMAQTPLPAFLYLSNLYWLNGVLYLAVFLMGYLKMKKKEEKSIFVCLAGFFLFCILILQMASTLTQRSLMLPRYLIFLNPIVIILFVFCLTPLKKSYRLALSTVMVILTLLGIHRAYYETKAPWRDLAHKVGEFPASHVLTTRTLAIRIPYLQSRGIMVSRLKPSEDTDFKSYFDSYQNLWVVENYWGGQNYLEDLEKKLIKQGFKTQTFTFQTIYSEPLSAMRITLQN